MAAARARPRRRSGAPHRSGGEHLGERCAMCRRHVVLDRQGRCPLGHQVAPPPDPAPGSDAGEAAGGLVASYQEPSGPPTTGSMPHVPVAGRQQPAQPGPTAVFDDPPPPLPLPGAEPPVSVPPALPVRPRGAPAPEPPARSLFREALGDGAAPAPARIGGDDGDGGGAGGGRRRTGGVRTAGHGGRIAGDAGPATIAIADLTPSAPSALDIDVSGWSPPLPGAEVGPAHRGGRGGGGAADDGGSDGAAERGEVGAAASWADAAAASWTDAAAAAWADGAADGDLELVPPRGVLQVVLAVVFVAALLGAAWYLATTL